jgi:hypothetical protein
MREKEGRFLKLGTLLTMSIYLPLTCLGQLNTGSNGSDGALDYSGLNYTTNIVIDMHDHPNGIYQYTYVNIPAAINFTFIPNANNTPLVWLVQSNVTIGGIVDVSGRGPSGAAGGIGGPGGYRGGTGGASPTSGQGPGGGLSQNGVGGNASYGSGGSITSGVQPGSTYGNVFLIPLVGGSGGGGSSFVGPVGGYGGGGAILIAASGYVQLDGTLSSSSGIAYFLDEPTSFIIGGAGSGGAIRIVASKIIGSGEIHTIPDNFAEGGPGRVRFDTYENDFGGSVSGVFTSGSQFIIIPTSGQLPQLTVTSVGGVSVSASPTGVLSTPDTVLSAQQNNPIPIVVSCANLSLNSLITVSITPANGASVSATGYNTTGTQTSSTVTISIVIPRGGGLIYATAATSN